MAEREKELAVVCSQEQLAKGIFSMWIRTKAAMTAVPGQFLSMYTNDKSKLLPRPISICEIDREKGMIRVVYRVTGEHTGTEEFSRMREGDTLPVIGPLGNGFPLEEARGRKAFLIGGGIGVPPILELAKQIDCEKQIIVGYRDDQIYACGPTPMLKAIKAYAKEQEIPCYISLEERMACGIGACLACVCKSKDKDHHSHVHNKRICKDGPVFLSTEVEL